MMKHQSQTMLQQLKAIVEQFKTQKQAHAGNSASPGRSAREPGRPGVSSPAILESDSIDIFN
jgi:hypothetical protein